jgi:hypothetical protein
LVIISQVQIQNNEKWKKQMPTAQKDNLKVIGVRNVTRITFLPKEFEGTVNIKINVFTSFDCWYGLQIIQLCTNISKLKKSYVSNDKRTNNGKH